ncbi:MAG: hypothetical protein CVV17_05495 [Gammaproteobacteria bacterium HGW-Gammaproteobacteria-7]|nr:MAG: hypothetical protein CVV17_05495 [Gammaproteobacteria bacterium HGW-Gammaproteobacteria-7]
MRTLIFVLLLALLAGCASKEQKVVSACESAVAERLAGKTYRLDSDALRTSLQTDATGVSSVRAEVILDPGMSGEQAQTVECSARFEQGQSDPVVIALNFIW